ncbi:MAG TPA: aconitate hydratase AcnA [Chloroflexota bacterium]|jgi:aconitate hydratase|nr:aconitate hydratase AcnA [Chloroflexota bacterium]
MSSDSTARNPFNTREHLTAAHGPYTIFSLPALAAALDVDLDQLPVTVKILVENVLRQSADDDSLLGVVELLARWKPGEDERFEFPYLPARVILQDFTGVPAVVDLAAMRSAISRLGGDPQRVNPLVPADLVIDHSVQVDAFGSTMAFERNVELEYERNRERYTLLRWAQQSFHQFRVVPPGTGIVHQVNLEYLSRVVHTRQLGSETYAFPDTIVGTDSHTTMVNGLGVLGWGVGGIEAEANLLGQPMYLSRPVVVGFHMNGELREGATATDLVLTVTEMLRKHGVVGKYVEFFGAGLSSLSIADRATLANMAPEYGATSALFPVDDETLRYLRMTGRDHETIDLAERYSKEQVLFRTDDCPAPAFDETLGLDLAAVEPSLAGPRRPQDRVVISHLSRNFREAFAHRYNPATPDVVKGEQRFDWEGGSEIEVHTAAGPPEAKPARGREVSIDFDGESAVIGDGSVVIAAITSCTNTSNPMVMVGAGLLAKHAVERGLRMKPYVKTSMAPGSRTVTDYLESAGLMPYLEALRFHVVGYGCTTCIGNSGPLPEPVAEAVDENDLVVVSVLSGNRNFEGRIHPQVRASYLASPPLVVAYALAGTVDIDLNAEPLGHDGNNDPVYLRDLWPSTSEVREAVEEAVGPEVFAKNYAHVFAGDELWSGLPVTDSALYVWDEQSTYVQEPPFFRDMSPEPEPLKDIEGARALVMVGDSVTTDHISPAGSIPKDSPAGRYLIEHGVEPRDFNSYGSRRGNDQVMVRGTFANIRLRNELVPDREGYWTAFQPGGAAMTIFEASERYRDESTPLLVIAGKEYGSGSSRDWAAKGPALLGVRAVLAESYERIHRSNLVGMGILPLQFQAGESRRSLSLSGSETFTIIGIAPSLMPRSEVAVHARKESGETVVFRAMVRIDTGVEVEYYRHGGVLQYVLRRLLADTAV